MIKFKGNKVLCNLALRTSAHRRFSQYLLNQSVGFIQHKYVLKSFIKISREALPISTPWKERLHHKTTVFYPVWLQAHQLSQTALYQQHLASCSHGAAHSAHCQGPHKTARTNMLRKH